MTCNCDKSRELAMMWRKYMRLTRGRVPSIRALEVIESETSDTQIRTLVSAMSRGMTEGMTMSEAAANHKNLISPSVLELLRYAEKTGAWDEIMIEIAEGLEDGTFSA